MYFRKHAAVGGKLLSGFLAVSSLHFKGNSASDPSKTAGGEGININIHSELGEAPKWLYLERECYKMSRENKRIFRGKAVSTMQLSKLHFYGLLNSSRGGNKVAMKQ